MHRNRVALPALTAPLLLLAGCVVIPVGDLLKGPALEEQVLARGEGFFRRDKIALIEVDGIITGDDSSGLLGSQENTVSEVKARASRALNDPAVRGVVLRISSPGGEVTACDLIHHEILELKRASRMPVVAVIVDEGASGGYYIASAADLVIAHPTAVVGSIGVILQTVNVAGLLHKIGVETLAVKSGDKKDLLSPFRARTAEEVAILKRLIDDFHQRFVDVAAARPGAPPREEVLKLADGRIFTGAEAQRLKLVDRVGYLKDAIDEVRKRANLDRKPAIVRYTRQARSGANIYSLAGAPDGSRGSAGLNLSLRAGDLFPRMRFLYLWQFPVLE